MIQKRSFRAVLAATGLALAALVGAGVVQARDVHWSVGVGVPGVSVGVGNEYPAPPSRPVYYTAPPVYYAPQPKPVYYVPPPPVYYPQPVYVAPEYYYRDGRRYQHHQNYQNHQNYRSHHDRYRDDRGGYGRTSDRNWDNR